MTGQSSREETVAHHWSHHDQQKEVDVRKKSTLVFVCCFFFCLFLHFIIKNKSVFVLYNTIQHPHRGSINHQSSTDKERNSFLVVSLVFLTFFRVFKKKNRVGGGRTWRVEGFLRRPGTLDKGIQGSSKAGRNTKHIWRGENLPRVRSLFCFLFFFFLIFL